MSSRRLVGSLLLVLVLALSASVVWSQTAQTGLVSGTVVDPEGQGIDSAVVGIARPDGSYARQVVTDSSGRFRLGFLPPGTYNLRVTAAGYLGNRLEGLRVSVGTKQDVQVQLNPSPTATERVEVTAVTPQIDVKTTERSLTLDREAIDRLPVSRTTTALLNFVPGSRRNQLYGGSTDQANSYQLDGVNVTDPGFGGEFLLPNIDWVEEFQVRGLGSGAEYGNFQGGLVNIVTRSGTNTLEGQARFNYEADSLSESNLSPLDAASEQVKRREFNASVGGPFIEDKLFYFFSVQRVDREDRFIDLTTSNDGDIQFLPINEERTEEKLLAKLTWQATDKDTFNFVGGYDDVETDNRGLDAFTAPEAAQTQDSPAVFYNLSWQRIFNERNFFELKVTGFDAEDDRKPRDNNLPAVQELGGDRRLFQNGIFIREQDRESLAISADWTSFFDTGNLEHNLKVGGSYDWGDWQEQRARAGNLTWRPIPGPNFDIDPLDPADWDLITSDWGGDINLDAETINAAIYVQDYLTVNQYLSVNFGVRYGMWEGELTPGFGDGGSFTPWDTDALAPRLGATVDFLGNQRWVAKIHWGQYYQNLFALLFDRAEGGNVFANTEFWDWDQAELPDLTIPYTLEDRENLFAFFDDTGVGEEVGPVDDSIDQPRVDQLVISLEHALTDRVTLGLTYINRENEDIISLVDLNQATNYTLFEDVTVDLGNGDTLVLPELFLSNDDILFVGSAPGLTDEQIAQLEFDPNLQIRNVDEAERDFDQVQFLVDYVGDRVSVNGSVVWTELDGNFFSVNGYDDPDGIGSGAFVRPNERLNFSGDLENYAEWEVKLRLAATLPAQVKIASFITWDSGEFFTRQFTIDDRVNTFFASDGTELDPDLLFGVDTQRVLLDPRGTDNLDSLFVVDFAVERPFKLSKRVSLRAELDLFNAFNEDSPTTVENAVDRTQPFGTVLQRQAGRTLRIGATLSF